MAGLLDWANAFPIMTSTSRGPMQGVQSFAHFVKSRSTSSRWLFAKCGSDLIQISTAINSGLLEADRDLPLMWITYWKWLELSAQNPKMKGLLFDELDHIAEIGLKYQYSIDNIGRCSLDLQQPSKVLETFRRNSSEKS